ncbi:MAG: hypothetical protein HYS33_08295, partial [Acidobacteria bacterium]|nr:hypothetical protein [Acidobacteriota bacterium]
MTDATGGVASRRVASGELRLMRRVQERCGDVLREACKFSSVLPEFLAALTANESGANPRAARFEPAVYRHLKAVADGRRPAYGGIARESLDAEIEEMLHPKAAAFHGVYLTASFAEDYATSLAASPDAALRDLATSWGYTQIMGYHMVRREGTVRDLLDARFHFRVALELLAEFAARYELDLAHEFDEMFRCWNTGQPYGETFHADYVA